MSLKLVGGHGKNYEQELEKARDELGKRLDGFTPLMDRIFIDFGLPIGHAGMNWESYIKGLDQLLADNFTLDLTEEK